MVRTFLSKLRRLLYQVVKPYSFSVHFYESGQRKQNQLFSLT